MLNRTIITLLILLPLTYGYSISPYPADTVITSENTSFTEKILIAPISLWQRLSYNTNFLQCQFYPSCSNYAAQSISNYGIFKGSAIAADRIIRCNPSAYHYHLRDRDITKNLSVIFHSDGRLVNPIPEFPLKREENGKSPVTAVLLSAIIPGTGRIYAGRTWDGIFGFLVFTLSANITYSHYLRDNTVRFNLFAFSTLVLYTGEIFGAYRAASLTPKKKTNQ